MRCMQSSIIHSRPLFYAGADYSFINDERLGAAAASLLHHLGWPADLLPALSRWVRCGTESFSSGISLLEATLYAGSQISVCLAAQLVIAAADETSLPLIWQS